MQTDNIQEFKDHLKRTLEQSGSLAKLKSAMRAELYKAANQRSGLSSLEQSPENLVINSLIRDYLAFNGYRETASVMDMEAGLSNERVIERPVLARRLGLDNVDGSVNETKGDTRLPLLYSLVASSITTKR